MHPSKKAQIANLKVDKAFTKVPSKYVDFVNVFSLKLIVKLSKHMGVNNYTIRLVDNQQPLYGFIYNLGSIKLEILKTYIKNNLANSFIKPSKFFVKTSIFFDKKLNRSLRLYINYHGFNNLTIKN